MTFSEAMHNACRELGLDSHIKTLTRKDAHTYAEKIASGFSRAKDFDVKNSFLFLDRMDFTFFQLGEEVAFSISGVCYGNDKFEFEKAISKALRLCELTEKYMKEG